MAASNVTNSTVAVIAADDSGIDLLHADVTVEDGETTVEHIRHEWLANAERVDLAGTWVRSIQLRWHGWRVVGDWRPTAHEGGLVEADVERS